MRRFVKYIACLKAYYFGLMSLYRLFRRSGIPLVLTYHRVVNSSEIGQCLSQAGMVVTAETFEKQIHFLQRSYRIVPLPDLVGLSASGATTRGACAITFDDGWLDTYSTAYPILKRLGVPATVFLTSGYVDTKRLFWPERLTSMMLHRETATIDAKALQAIDPAISRIVRAIVSSNARSQRMKEIDELIVRVKQSDQPTRNSVLEFLGVSDVLSDQTQPETRHLLNWREVQELKDAGFSIGSHTVNHVILTQVSPDVAQTEIMSSKQAIETKIGEPVTLFAYPNGDWNPVLKELVRGAGYLGAVVTDNAPGADQFDRFAIGRVNVHEGTSASPSGKFSRAVFACEISGLQNAILRGRLRRGY